MSFDNVYSSAKGMFSSFDFDFSGSSELETDTSATLSTPALQDEFQGQKPSYALADPYDYRKFVSERPLDAILLSSPVLQALTNLACVLGSDDKGPRDSDTGIPDNDKDGDGYEAGEYGDCDDNDPNINPSTMEICDDAIDQNCDGEDGASQMAYQDLDDDGYGDETVTALYCNNIVPSGYATQANDCDDTNPDVHRYAPEICNGMDDDCVGGIDNGLTDETYYEDIDADGYGNPDVSQSDCLQPEGYAAVDGDCDDVNPAIHPELADTCDQLDNDCDGEIDEDESPSMYYRDADADGYGADELGATCDPSIYGGSYSEANGDCDDTDPLVNPGLFEVNDDGLDNDCDGEADIPSDWYLDSDGDGFGDPNAAQSSVSRPAGHVADATDCDDASPSVYPDALESCNGFDDDCDGAVDEDGAVDGPIWYADSDADGYGDSGSSITSCRTPSGYTSLNEDCDDTNAAIYPQSAEYCNGTDDDCDGSIDEGSAVDASVYYADVDADGFGDPDDPGTYCTMPSDHVSDATDCDDLSDTVNPAASEYCNETDDDCDGLVDEDAIDALTFYLDSDGDGYSDGSSPQTSCATAGYASILGDCDETDALVNSGALEYCDGIDNDCDSEIDEADAVDANTWYTDIDLDGFGDDATAAISCTGPAGSVLEGGDCNEADNTINPAAIEYCDLVDNNCSGQADELAVGGEPIYPDGDGDGFGNAQHDLETTSCYLPVGYTRNADDCDDDNPDIFLGADEICDGIDNDCDGSMDEGVATTAYIDADADGYGNSDTESEVCALDALQVIIGGDCNDANASINPSASEYCDEWDNDCDGITDPATSLDATEYWRDADSDGYGNASINSGRSCIVIPGSVANDDDCDDARPLVFPNAPETCNSIDDDCDGATDDGVSITVYEDADNDTYGSTIASQACILSNGYADNSDDCDDSDPATYPDAPDVLAEGAVSGVGLLDGNNNSCGTRDYSGPFVVDEGGIEFTGSSGSDNLGLTNALANVGDVNGDGIEDLIVASQNANDGSTATDVGTVYLIPGSPAHNRTETAQSNASAIWLGEAAGDKTGRVGGNGDMDGDGFDDYGIASITKASNAGKAYFQYGSSASTGLSGLSSASFALTGPSASGRFGASMAMGDVNGDGLDDWAVGAPGSSTSTSAIYLYFGGTTRETGTLAASTADATLVDSTLGNKTGEDLDLSMSDADWNGDGYSDLLVGSVGASSSAGKISVVELGSSTSGSVAISPDFTITGSAAGDQMGFNASWTRNEDVNGDGLADILAGAPVNDDASSNAGAFYLAYSGLSGTVSADSIRGADGLTVTGGSTGAFFGTSACSGDVNRDGTADFLVGAYGANIVYLFDGAVVMGISSPIATISDLSGMTQFTGVHSGDGLGYSLACLNLDGLDGDDLVIAGPTVNSSDRGSAYVIGSGY